MGTFLAYNLKLSICFLLFYLLYRVLLCRNTFHRTNRAVLLSAYLFILFVPLIPLATIRPPEIHEIIGVYEVWLLQTFYVPVETVSSQPVIRWAHIAVLIYALGILFFACRYLYFLIQIGLRIRSSEKIRLENHITLVINEKNTTPCSWMHYIMLSTTDAAENRTTILSHEQAHIKRRHSIDLMIADLLTIIQWYNPFIWLMKNELQNVHEYEADEATLHSGVDAKQYQLLLIERAVGSPCFNSMSNSLNHSKLKKRIAMMLKKKNSPWARLKYMSILPLAALAVTLFARPEISAKIDEISAVKVSDFTSMNEVIAESFANVSNNAKENMNKEFVSQQDDETTAQSANDSLPMVHRSEDASPDLMPVFIGEYGDIIEYLGYRLQYPEEAVKAGVTIRAVYSFVVEKDGSVNDIKWVTTHVARDSNNPDVIAAQTACEKAAYDIIASTSYKWKPAQKNGMPASCEMSLPIWFKFPETQVCNTDSVLLHRKENEQIELRYEKDEKTAPIYIVDGVEVANASSVNPKDIHAVTIYKNDAATSLYGARASGGVILITTKKGKIKQ